MLNLRELNHFSSFTYARFEAFNLLERYEKVFYVDTDIVIQKDISKIINIETTLSISYFANKMPVSGNFTKENIDLVKDYDLNKVSIIAAVFLINDKLNDYQIMTKWCYEKAEEYKTNDQSILNLLIQEFNIETHDLTESYGAYPTSNISKDAHIIHAIGPAKFWRGTYNKDWEENNKIWIESGGNTAYKENAKKRKLVDKIVWLIPNYNLRNKLRGYLLKKIGLSGR